MHTAVEVVLRVKNLAVLDPQITRLDLKVTRPRHDYLSVSVDAAVRNTDNAVLLLGMVEGMNRRVVHKGATLLLLDRYRVFISSNRFHCKYNQNRKMCMWGAG